MVNKILNHSKPLLVLEMANNHQGDIEHGKRIIDEFYEVCKDFTNYINIAFKFQYMDYKGAPSDTETFAQGAIFDGDNNYIEGTNNLITGSVNVGNAVGFVVG